MKKRKICVITGSRADYGLLMPLIKEIRDDSGLKLQLIVTAMHLSQEFGLTYMEIEKDGFRIDEKIKILSHLDTPVGISEAMGLAIREFSKAYKRLKPDIAVVLGDRFEIFSAASAALVNRVSLAHIHGGELTEGVFDDAFRHAITKMSHLHFVSTEEYRKRVIQLGEDLRRVFNVGALGLENIRSLKFLSRKALEKELGFRFGRQNLLVTFHPVTLSEDSLEQFRNLLKVLEDLRDTHVIFTKANADTGGRSINRLIDRYVSKNSKRSAAFTSMGTLRYLSTMRQVDAVVGNSSSGIIEAPSLKVATVNIGDRQRGRVRADSVIDCKPIKEAIRKAIGKAYSQSFRKVLKGVKNPHGGGNTARKIKNILKDYKLDNIVEKKFYDIERIPSTNTKKV